MQKRITSYKELADWSNAFVNETDFGLFFLVGAPGHAKSYTIRKLMKDREEKAKQAALKPRGRGKNAITLVPPPNHLWIEGGAVSAFKFYQDLWVHRNATVVLDDVDSVYTDRNLVRLLKSLCQTEAVRTIGWHTANRELAALGIDQKFETTSRVCIIANRWETLNEHVGSLISRGVMIQFDPSVEEVFKYIKDKKIITDAQVLTFISKHLKWVQRLDIRDCQQAVKAKKSNQKLDWKDALLQSFGIRDVLLVKELLGKKKRYDTTEQCISEFMRRTGQSRPMFHKAQKQLDSLSETRVKKVYEA